MRHAFTFLFLSYIFFTPRGQIDKREDMETLKRKKERTVGNCYVFYINIGLSNDSITVCMLLIV